MKVRIQERQLGCAILLLLSALAPKLLLAQEFPNRPIIMVIPQSPGGASDAITRTVIAKAVEYLGQPILIQNKPGAGGIIGTEFVAKSKPDGYTLLFATPGYTTTLPAIEGTSKGPDDLDAVCRLNYTQLVFVAHPDAPFKTFKGMLESAKANPGKLVFGNSGHWSMPDVAWKLIKVDTGITSRDIPHDGGGPLIMAILGGVVQVTALYPSNVLAQIKAGKLRPIAVMNNKRLPELPNVPTVKEEGVDALVFGWRAIMAPKGTPRPIIDKLALAFKKMTEDKTIIEGLKRIDNEVDYKGTDEFTEEWRNDFRKSKELAKIFQKK